MTTETNKVKGLKRVYQTKDKRVELFCKFAANLYGNCVHGCLYCSAPKTLRKKPEAFHKKPKVPTNVLVEFQHDCRIIAALDIPQEEKRIHLSFVTDPYQPEEEKKRLTRAAILLAHDSGIGVQILTKGAVLAQRDFELLGKLDVFGVTLTLLDEKMREHWEPKADPTIERIKALGYAKNLGLRTMVSLEPVIDSEQSLEIVRQTHSIVDMYYAGKLNYHEHAKSIDWRKYAMAVTELLEGLPSKYRIKDELLREI
jgi:DNA repair photolyase